LTIGFAAYGYSFYLFLTWLPAYMAAQLYLGLIKSGLYAAVPWLVAAVADLVVGGWLVDYLIARGNDPTRVRKTILVAGLLLGLAIAPAVTTRDPLIATRGSRSRWRVRRFSADRLVDSRPHRAARQHGQRRLDHELRQQPHGHRRADGHGFHRRGDALVLRGLSYRGGLPARRDRLLRVGARADRTDPRTRDARRLNRRIVDRDDAGAFDDRDDGGPVEIAKTVR